MDGNGSIIGLVVLLHFLAHQWCQLSFRKINSVLLSLNWHWIQFDWKYCITMTYWHPIINLSWPPGASSLWGLQTWGAYETFSITRGIIRNFSKAERFSCARCRISQEPQKVQGYKISQCQFWEVQCPLIRSTTQIVAKTTTFHDFAGNPPKQCQIKHQPLVVQLPADHVCWCWCTCFCDCLQWQFLL